MGQRELQRQQHERDKGNSHSPALLVGKARQRITQLLPLCVCAGVSVQAECLKSGRKSQTKPFSSSLLTTAPSVPGQEAVNVKQQFSALIAAGSLRVYKLV